MSKVCIAAIVICFCLLPSALGATAQTLLYLNGQPGDYIFGGQQRTFTQADGTFSITYTSGRLQVSFNGSTDWWSLNFGAPTGLKLVKAEYEGAQRFAFHSPTKPGLDVYGDGRGCNIVKGRFLVSQLVLASDGSVQNVAVDFEQHCEGGPAALYGSIRFNSAISLVPRVSAADATVLKGNVGSNSANVVLSLSMPSSSMVSVQYNTADGSALQGKDYLPVSGTMQFQAGTTSQFIQVPVLGDRLARGNKIFHVVLSNSAGAPLGDKQGNVKIFDPNIPMKVLAMYGQPGDYISPGLFLETAAEGLFAASRGSDNSVSVFLNDGNDWTTDFLAPNKVLLTAGDYENAQRYPFEASGLPGLSVYGDGRGCNTLTGRFVVNKVSYTSTGSVQILSADFEQHCEGFAAALFGSVRLNSKLTQFSLSDALIDTTAETATFTVTLNPAVATTVSVDFTTVDGSALAGTDYVATSQTVSFSPGQVQQTVSVPLLTANGGSKQFFGQLTNPLGEPVWIRQGIARF